MVVIVLPDSFRGMEVRKNSELQVVLWLLHQTRSCSRAMGLAVKLKTIVQVRALAAGAYTPAPPGPKRQGRIHQ